MQIAAIPKGKRAEIRVTLQEYHGRTVLDLRVWHRPRHFKDRDPMVRTPRGITVAIERAQFIAQALLQALAVAQSQRDEAVE